jgi:hypothetical protein
MRRDVDYVLLYPDGSEVFLLPGTTKLFELSSYKEFRSIPYKQIILYLCQKETFFGLHLF